MSSNPKGNTQASNKQNQNADAMKDTSQMAIGNQPADKSESMNNSQTKQGRDQNQNSRKQRFGQESWNEFSSKSKKSESNDQQSSRGQNRPRNMYDQGRPTHEWERRQEQEYSGQRFTQNSPRQGWGWNDRGYGRDTGYNRGQQGQWGGQSNQGNYGRDRSTRGGDDRQYANQRESRDYESRGNDRDSRYNQGRQDQWRGQNDRGNYNRDRSDYGNDYNQSATRRENRESGSIRDYSEEYQTSGNRESQERGRGERGERMPGGNGPSVSSRGYENHRGNRETAGQHRYGGRPERDYDQDRDRQSSMQWDREGDYSDRNNRQDWQSSDRGWQDQRSQSANQRRSERQGSDWSRDRVSDSYNMGQSRRQDRSRNENQNDDESYESDRDRSNIH
jgi:hypothetical protein